MPSLHKILKLKAGFRASAQARLFPRVKSEKHKSHKDKPAGAPDPATACRPSFRNSFVSSFSSCASPSATSGAAAAIDLKHGKHRVLTASEALSRVVATPSVHGPFRQSSQPLIDGSDSEWFKGLSEKTAYVIPSRRAHEVLGKAASKGVHSVEKAPCRRIEEDSKNALASLRHEIWNERRSRVLGSDFKADASKRALRLDINRNFSESRGEKIEAREDAVTSRSCEELTEKRLHRDVSEDLPKAEKVQTCGKASSRSRGSRPEKGGPTGAGRPQPMKSRLVAVRLFNGSAICPRAGVLYARALHDVSLAGAGLPLDRTLENEHTERQSDQSASDGKSLKLLSGACNIPHPDKIKTGGEDAYFICPDKHVVGVADGVGGWADLGVDAGAYARELMSQSMIAVRQEPPGSIDPARVMEKAHSQTKCKGSSTACILALSDSVLEAANLGDSGFVLVRNSQTIFKSPVQQHQFNMPFQLESGGSDPPSAAQVFSLQVAVGDIIVAGTDGLFDNLYDTELTTLIVQAVRVGMAPQVTAQKLASLARARAQDRNRQTPFSTAAQDAGYRFYGGKMDDITVIVSYITSSKSATAAS